MKKVLILAAMGAAVLSSCNNGATNAGNDNSKIDSLQNIIDQKDNEINQMMGTFNEIQEGFSLINQAEGRINSMSGDMEISNSAEAIRENMEFIQQTMQKNRERIGQLEAQIAASNINATKLREAIATLTAQLEAKDRELASLRLQLAEKDVEIANLNENVETLTTENNEVRQQRDASQALAKSQDVQLNTAYYVFGTSRELKEHNILKSGDVLKGDYDKNYFTKIDIRKTQVIALNSKSAKVMTNHPAGSYSLLKDTKGEYTLRINNAEQFWSASKYLVILTK